MVLQFLLAASHKLALISLGFKGGFKKEALESPLIGLEYLPPYILL